jgi:hypothetical protein
MLLKRNGFIPFKTNQYTRFSRISEKLVLIGVINDSIKLIKIGNLLNKYL